MAARKIKAADNEETIEVEVPRTQKGVKKSILLITVGHANWEPTPEQLDSVRDLFMAAAEDPLGAVIAVPWGISVQNIEL